MNYLSGFLREWCRYAKQLLTEVDGFGYPVNLLMGSISVERRATRINCTVMDNTVLRQIVNNSPLMEAVCSSGIQVEIQLIKEKKTS